MRIGKLLIGILLLVLMIASVSALEFPLVVNGVLQGDNVGNQEVKVTNQRTGDVFITHSVSNGQFLADVRNYQAGDHFRVEVTVCAALSGACVQTHTYTGSEIRLYGVYDLGTAIACPAPTPCPSSSCSGGGGGSVTMCTETQCRDKFPCHPDDPDCGECTTCSPCPEIDRCDQIDEHCPNQLKLLCELYSGDYCTEEVCKETVCDEVECPDQSNIAAILGILAAIVMAMGGGIKMYKNRAGGITQLHRHRGILGYHDMNTRHKNPEYRHASFTKNPAQFVKDLKRINEGS